jgi:Ecdysteroid kinase-like family
VIAEIFMTMASHTPEPLSSAEQVTPEWLTGVLRREGRLERGEVVGVRVASSRSLIVSSVARLEVSYTAGALGPASLFLKLSTPELQAHFSRREVDFYNTVARASPELPLIRCYDAAFSEATGASHLLLEDLSETHTQTQAPLPPSARDCELAVESLALLHARWWGSERLGVDIGALTTEAEFEELRALLEKHLAGFADFLGDRLLPRRLKTYERILAGPLTPWRRMLRREGLTVTHGDAHWWNFLYPRAEGPAVLFDWHLWHVDAPLKDLAYLIALNWYPSRRAVLEQKLLRRYHEALLGAGVSAYGWDACLRDYRVQVIRELFVPVWQWSSGMTPALWWSSLEKIWLAFEDLGCAELIES